MDQPVQPRQICTPDPQQVIGLTRQGPGRDHLGQGRNQGRKAACKLWIMAGELHLNKGLHRQAHPRRINPRRIAGDKSLGLQPLAAARGLTGR